MIPKALPPAGEVCEKDQNVFDVIPALSQFSVLPLVRVVRGKNTGLKKAFNSHRALATPQATHLPSLAGIMNQRSAGSSKKSLSPGPLGFLPDSLSRLTGEGLTSPH